MHPYRTAGNEGVSVLTPVSSLTHAGNVFTNYMRQDMGKKELILVHGNPAEDFEQWIPLSRLYPFTRVYCLNEGVSLGESLNYCVSRAIFEYIAIFQEMHHYEGEYLSAAVREMVLHSAELAGKKTYYSGQKGQSRPMLVNPGFEDCFADTVLLPTFVFRQSICGGISFPHRNTELDTSFCSDCREKGYRVYSTGAAGFHFCHPD